MDFAKRNDEAARLLARQLAEMTVERDNLRTVLKGVLVDIADYERVNNLSPNPGRKYCWDSVATAYRVLEEVK